MRRTERQHPYFTDDDSEGLRMLRRILITLSVYDAEVAYVQGMNEIVAPILLTLQVTLLEKLSLFSLKSFCYGGYKPVDISRLLVI